MVEKTAQRAATTSQPTDEELMTAFQQGDPTAFESLYNRYRKGVFSFIYRKCLDRDKAGDITQDVFTRVIQGAKGYRQNARFSTWIFTIARNLIIDEGRKAKHRRARSLDQPKRDDGPTYLDKVANGAPQPDRTVIAHRLQGELARAIERLPDDQKEVFWLRQYQNLPFQEIAEVVGAKEGTVKSRMRYALNTLKEALKSYESYARTLR